MGTKPGTFCSRQKSARSARSEKKALQVDPISLNKEKRKGRTEGLGCKRERTTPTEDGKYDLVRSRLLKCQKKKSGFIR